MGQATPTKDERNRMLKQDVESGKFTMIELINKYQISSQRIYQIVKREKEKNG